MKATFICHVVGRAEAFSSLRESREPRAIVRVSSLLHFLNGVRPKRAGEKAAPQASSRNSPGSIQHLCNDPNTGGVEL